MKVVSTIIGDFTFNEAQKFRRAYQKAVKGDVSCFKHGKRDYEIEFAGCMVEYLESNFNLESEDEH